MKPIYAVIIAIVGPGLILCALITVSCMSMQRRETIERGSPTWQDVATENKLLTEQVQRLREQVGALNERLNVDREAQRDDLEKVMTFIAGHCK